MWLASACSLPRLLTSRPLMNGPGGSTDLSSFAPRPVCQPKVTTDKSVPYCTAWGKMQRIPSLPQHLQRRSEDNFFKVRKNVIFEWVQLNRHCQGESESAEQFITSLYHLAENCEYGDLRDQMIRDRIVVRIRDQLQFARLQMNAELTLEKAKTLVRQHEAVQEQQVLLQTGQAEKSVDFLRQNPQFKGKGTQRK